MDKEWKVLLNGVLFSDRFNSEGLAYAHVEECVAEGYGDENDFEVLEMTEDDMEEYE